MGFDLTISESIGCAIKRKVLVIAGTKMSTIKRFPESLERANT